MIPNRGWARTAAAVAELEERGFDVVALDDHIVNPVSPLQPWTEVWTGLAAIAASTSRVSLGPIVSNAVLRHPVLLARQALTVNEMSGGRLELGLGAGYAPSDLAAVGVDSTSKADWQARFIEAVETVHALLRGQPGFTGRWFDTSGVQLCDPADAPVIPLTLAADSPASLDLAARLADRWVNFGGWGLSHAELVDLNRQRAEVLAERCEVHGRAGAVGMTLLVGSAAVCAEPMWTSAAAFEDFIGPFVELGVDTFVCYWPPSSVSRNVDRDAVEEIVNDTMPRLRSAVSAPATPA